jgi:predicted amidohydrolase YtcJ
LFAEDRLGSLTPGKLADVVVLDADVAAIPSGELASVEVAMTFLGGRLVHGDAP